MTTLGSMNLFFILYKICNTNLYFPPSEQLLIYVVWAIKSGGKPVSLLISFIRHVQSIYFKPSLYFAHADMARPWIPFYRPHIGELNPFRLIQFSLFCWFSLFSPFIVSRYDIVYPPLLAFGWSESLDSVHGKVRV